MQGPGLRSSSLSAFPALVLNADYQPLSYFPLSLWNWQETVKAIFLDRVAVVSHYDRKIRSPGMEMQLASVVALKQYIPQGRRPPFTRFNVFLRDRFTCQYCSEPFPGSRSHLRPSGTAQPWRPDMLDQYRDRLQSLQSQEGRQTGEGVRYAAHVPARDADRLATATETAAPSRRISCTRAGATISTGTASSRIDARRLRPSFTDSTARASSDRGWPIGGAQCEPM